MSKEIYISSTPHETRLAIVENDALAEIYYERENEYTLAGSIYNGRVTRVLPGMQSSFVDIGLERDAFLYITDFMEEAGDSADFESEGGQKSGRREPATLEGSSGSDRGGRGRRDRRDRGGNRDRQQQQQGGEYGTPQDTEENIPEESYSAETFEASEEEGVSESLGESVGEGAPGADGSRRWRGRRGRRRGRGRQQQQQAGEQSVETPSGEVEGEEYEAPLELEASTETEEEIAAPEVVSGEYPQESSSRRERGGREDRGRGRRDRGGRRVPRGFAPRTSFYGLEGNEPEESVALENGATPIILPGESLSKYRTGEEQPVSAPKAAAPVVAAPTAPGYEIPEGWDGGLTLPGESLSRHRRSTPVAPVASVIASVPEAVEETVEEEEQVSAPVAEKTEEAKEYEPTEASASYRFDPVPPSEFRQSAPFEEEEAASPVEEIVAQHSELPHVEIEQAEMVAVAEPVAVEEADQHEVTSIHASGEMVSPEPVADPVEVEAEHQAFEPGTQETTVEVEEEEADDSFDETALDPATLFASSIEELDDFDEEETLEGAADLGTMIREMSIDEITSANLEDEEDFEEEDAIDDSSFVATGAEFAVSDDAEDLEEDLTHDEYGSEEGEPVAADGAAPEPGRRDFDRRRGRRDRRSGGRDRGRHSGGGDRERRGGRGRSSMQATDLPAITELLKPGQEILVQIAKEPIAKKGARITSHIALPGRFLVFMPTVNHTGVSRKIESDSERRRLKEILLSEKGDAAGGFIVRTAASGASEEELRSDLRFLLHLWADIKQRSESSKSPALIYHDLNLVERILRDQVTDTFSAIWVDTETEYERVLRFLQRFQPSLIRRVKLYTKETPLFEQFGISEEINKALRSKVWLKSGGSIVINQTEALVAIDINTGKYVGKTARLEDTIVKTNLDAIPEIVRQIRLRDLGGIIIIDFIDMDERKNRNRVMAALEEELKRDRAPSKILQFNDFGLVAITRKRVKQSLERTLSTQCSICTGTGMVKSPITVCNDIYIEMRKMSKHLDRGDVMLRVHPDVVKQLKSSTKWLQELEEMVGKTILVKSDPSLHPEQFDIH
ncbi:MAG TPA: Rne/Rng family ribonuclease [Edaphobacter sp.]|nr:Rne/Rng family ribonuclease [Edaphobacter sp.]